MRQRKLLVALVICLAALVLAGGIASLVVFLDPERAAAAPASPLEAAAGRAQTPSAPSAATQHSTQGRIYGTSISIEGDGRSTRRAEGAFTNPLFDGADPGVLLVDGVYHVWTTMNGHASSRDMASWAADSQPVSRSEPWAPEVFRKEEDGGFYIVYSGGSGDNTGHEVFVDRADSPAGPWKPHSGPLIPRGFIDGHIFKDTDGQLYLYASIVGSGISVWTLSADLKRATGRKFLFDHKSHPEKWITEPVHEGPYMLKRNGIYYLTFSANGCCLNDLYGVGVAVGESPLGPFVKAKNNPLLWKTSEVGGVGHHSFTVGPNGGLACLYHAHKPGLRTATDQRHVLMSAAWFEKDPAGGPELLRIAPAVRGKPQPVP